MDTPNKRLYLIVFIIFSLVTFFCILLENLFDLYYFKGEYIFLTPHLSTFS